MTPPLAAFLAVVTATLGATLATIAWRRAKMREVLDAGGTDPRAWSPWRNVLRLPARYLAPTGTDRDDLVSRLQQAGRTAKEELDRFLEEKLLGYVLGFTCGPMAFLLVGGQGGLLLMLVCFTVGMLLPSKRLDVVAQERRQLIAIALPGAIDLLMTCVDAGLSVEQAVKRVATEFSRSSPILAEEFGLCASECEAGVSLSEALRRMSRRVELDDMSGLCSVIAQAHELGAPIVATLSDYATSARKVRMAKLEEWAGQLAMKMMFPVALFLLPAALVVMLGPSLVSVIETMRGT